MCFRNDFNAHLKCSQTSNWVFMRLKLLFLVLPLLKNRGPISSPFYNGALLQAFSFWASSLHLSYFRMQLAELPASVCLELYHRHSPVSCSSQLINWLKPVFYLVLSIGRFLTCVFMQSRGFQLLHLPSNTPTPPAPPFWLIRQG